MWQTSQPMYSGISILTHVQREQFAAITLSGVCAFGVARSLIRRTSFTLAELFDASLLPVLHEVRQATDALTLLGGLLVSRLWSVHQISNAQHTRIVLGA